MAPTPLHQRTDAILRRLVRKDAGTAVRKILGKTRAEDIAAAMQHMTAAERHRLFKLIDDKNAAASVLVELHEDGVAEITQEIPIEDLTDLLDRMDPDDATDIIELLPIDLRNRIVAALSEVDDDVSQLLAWPSDSAGGLMSPNVFKMSESATCGEAIRNLQEQAEDFETVFYLYVVDARNRLVGVISLRTLLMHPPRTPLVSIMNEDVIAVSPREDQEEVAHYVARYDLLGVPVVDEERRLLGIVTVDDVLDVIRDEAAEDMLLMAGVGEDFDLSDHSAFSIAKQRAGWLLATAVGGILADRLTHLYGDALPLEVLAGLIPVVMGMGGNVGIQSTTIAVRGIAVGHVQISGAWSFIFREGRVGLLLGTLYGVILGIYGIVTGWPDPSVGISVGISVFLAITLGSLLGSGLPLLLKRLGADPAVATGPFVTTAVDILGIFVYFSVARIVLGM